MPEPMAKEPKNTTMKLRKDMSIIVRSNLSFSALATYFSMELEDKHEL